MTASSDALGPTMQSPDSVARAWLHGYAEGHIAEEVSGRELARIRGYPVVHRRVRSIAACERYGKGHARRRRQCEGPRRTTSNKVVVPAEGGEDSPTAKWVKGDNPFGRTAVVMLAAIAATLFGFLNIGLAFTALMAFIGALLLLVVGVFFACLWIIPGRPRQWGLNWFEALIGLVLQSFLAMLVFGTALTLVTAVFTLTGSLGWLPVTGLAIVVLIVGFRLRRLLDSLTTMMRPGAGSIMLGGMARRGAMGAVRKIMGALSSRGAAPAPAERGRDRTRTQTRVRSRCRLCVCTARLPLSALWAERPRGVRRTSSRLVQNGAAQMRPRRPGGTGPGGQPAAGDGGRVAASASPSRGTSALNLARARTQSKGEGRRTISVTAAGVAAAGGRAAAKASRGEAAKARHSRRPIPAPANEIRYEPRIHTHSASLREGPPKGQRIRRKAPTSQQRRFREYSAVTKDGVTVHVPTRR